MWQIQDWGFGFWIGEGGQFEKLHQKFERGMQDFVGENVLNRYAKWAFEGEGQGLM